MSIYRYRVSELNYLAEAGTSILLAMAKLTDTRGWKIELAVEPRIDRTCYYIRAGRDDQRAGTLELQTDPNYWLCLPGNPQYELQPGQEPEVGEENTRFFPYSAFTLRDIPEHVRPLQPPVLTEVQGAQPVVTLADHFVTLICTNNVLAFSTWVAGKPAMSGAFIRAMNMSTTHAGPRSHIYAMAHDIGVQQRANDPTAGVSTDNTVFEDVTHLRTRYKDVGRELSVPWTTVSLTSLAPVVYKGSTTGQSYLGIGVARSMSVWPARALALVDQDGRKWVGPFSHNHYFVCTEDIK